VGQLYEEEKFAARKLLEGGVNELRCSSTRKEKSHALVSLLTVYVSVACADIDRNK